MDKILLCALAAAILSEHILKHNEPKTEILELVNFVQSSLASEEMNSMIES
jgi:hypothetical protein